MPRGKCGPRFKAVEGRSWANLVKLNLPKRILAKWNTWLTMGLRNYRGDFSQFGNELEACLELGIRKTAKFQWW